VFRFSPSEAVDCKAKPVRNIRPTCVRKWRITKTWRVQAGPVIACNWIVPNRWYSSVGYEITHQV